MWFLQIFIFLFLILELSSYFLFMISHFLMLLWSSGMLLAPILIVFMNFSHFIIIFPSIISIYAYSRIHCLCSSVMFVGLSDLFLYFQIQFSYFTIIPSGACCDLIIYDSIHRNELFYPLIFSHAHLRIFTLLFLVKFPGNLSFVLEQWFIVRALWSVESFVALKRKICLFLAPPQAQTIFIIAHSTQP